jgi:23S rRNA pseudouridine2605 synthase/23S rRNA pseudouridine2604 synthase
VLERIQKILSARGIASRRKAEDFIRQGLVLVNGEPATIGQKADPETDRIEVAGEVIEARKELQYYVMNKPRGVVTTNAHMPGVKTVQELLPKELRGKVFTVGRLDKDSSGLLLLTNDGVLAYRLTHPKFDHAKEYEVETERPVTDGQLEKLEKGMIILGERTKTAKVRRIAEKRFRITLTEGKNRQIRRMCLKVGNKVATLRRVRIMTLEDDRLKEGHYRELSAKEKTDLLTAVKL